MIMKFSKILLKSFFAKHPPNRLIGILYLCLGAPFNLDIGNQLKGFIQSKLILIK